MIMIACKTCVATVKLIMCLILSTPVLYGVCELVKCIKYNREERDRKLYTEQTQGKENETQWNN